MSTRPIKKYFNFSSASSRRKLLSKYSTLLSGPSSPLLSTLNTPAAPELPAGFPNQTPFKNDLLIDARTHEEACRLALRLHEEEEGLPSSSSSSSSSEDDEPMTATATAPKKKKKDEAINVRELRRARRALEMLGVSLPSSSPSSVLARPLPSESEPSTSQPSTSASARVVLCTGKKCSKRGAGAALAHLEQIGGSDSSSLKITTKCSGCQGLCGKAPVMRVKVEGSQGPGQLFAGVSGSQEVEEALTYSILLARQQKALKLSVPEPLDLV